MTIALPSYFQSKNINQNRRTDEQDEYNRRVAQSIDQIQVVLIEFFGDLDRFQSKDFFVSKIVNPSQDFRFRHNFGFVATNYAVLNAQNNGGGSSSVDWPVRSAPTIPTDGVDDKEFITLTFSGRGDYVIRVSYDTRIADELGSIEGPS